MEIKIIPYEDRKKYCTHFYFADSKEDMIARACQELNFEQIKQLVNLIDSFDFESYRKHELTIQVGNNNFETLNPV